MNSKVCITEALLLLGIVTGLMTNVSAMLDLDGDHASELWQLSYPEIGSELDDPDGDGVNNLNEEIAGTNPLDASDYLKIENITLASTGVFVSWSGVGGKYYRIEKFNVVTHVWESIAEMPPSVTSGPHFIEITNSPDNLAQGNIIRLNVTDIDQDGDGLSAWEEYQLGYNDQLQFTSTVAGRNDYALALRRIEQEGGAVIRGGREIPRRLPTRKEAARFLVQSTFGPTEELVNEVTSIGMGAWIDRQIYSEAISETKSIMFQNHRSYTAQLWREGLWRTIFTRNDQLRQRTAYALSQIVVAGFQGGNVVGDNSITQATHYDKLLSRAFGNYRDVINDMTYSPVMGFYLSHLKNRKSDPSSARFPDENFARELMQLFTIGLWELNEDGSRKVDLEGADIPSYDNETITELAKVFTGFTHGTHLGLPATGFFGATRGTDYYPPMEIFDEEHEPGEKKIVSGIIISEDTNGDGIVDENEQLSARDEVELALDTLVDHPNTAPFISKLLIQRFTSSNPSPEYVTRVVGAWNFGTQRGALHRVIEAILLDPEVRTAGVSGDTSGKVREPFIRTTHVLRAFNPTAANDQYVPLVGRMLEEIGQYPTLPPSVFNFYLPDYQPAGEMRLRKLTSPELQIATTSKLLTSDNFFREITENGFFGLKIDKSPLIELADDPDALLDELDLKLTWGEMSAETRETIKTAITGSMPPQTRVLRALHLICSSPDFTVLR